MAVLKLYLCQKPVFFVPGPASIDCGRPVIAEDTTFFWVKWVDAFFAKTQPKIFEIFYELCRRQVSPGR
jgi:hypothetical protein